MNFAISPDVLRHAMIDSPAVVPVSGEQQSKQRRYHNTVAVKHIRDCFGAQTDLNFEHRGLILDVLSDCELDARWGPLFAPPAENNPTNPTDSGIVSWVSPVHSDNLFTFDQTKANRQPRGAIFYTGTTNFGVFTWRNDGVGETLDIMRWNGTTWTVEAEISIPVSGTPDSGGLAWVVHNGALLLLMSAEGVSDGAKVYSSTTGDTFAALANDPIATGAYSGSMLISDGLRLYAFLQYANSTFDVTSTDDSGATAWTSRATGLQGPLRDYARFLDLDGNEQIIILTENNFGWWDTTDFVLHNLGDLPNRGMALQAVSLKGEPRLLIFTDAMQVYSYRREGGIPENISPGGIQGMPDGKDFSLDPNGQVCLAVDGRWLHCMWSGTYNDGNPAQPLILALNLENGGWYYIWEKTDTSISNAARFIFVDPQSGDLIGAVQDATGVDSTLLRFKDIDIPPDLQATLDRDASARTFEIPRLDFGGPIVSTLVLDIFAHTKGLASGKTLAHACRINGNTGAYTAIGSAFTVDNTRVTLPSNLATDVGTNCRDFQCQVTLDPNAVTDNIRINSIDIGFTRIWPVRPVYVIDFLLKDFGDPQLPNMETQRTNLETVQGAVTKVTLRWNNTIGDKYVLPIPEWELKERMPAIEILPAMREGHARMVFIEA